MQSTTRNRLTAGTLNWSLLRASSGVRGSLVSAAVQSRRRWLTKSPLLVVSLALHALVILGVCLFVPLRGNGGGLYGSFDSGGFSATWIPGEGGGTDGGKGGGKSNLKDTVVPDDESAGSGDLKHSVEVQPAKQESPLLDVAQTDPQSVFDADTADRMNSLKEAFSAIDRQSQSNAVALTSGNEASRSESNAVTGVGSNRRGSGLVDDGGKTGTGEGGGSGSGLSNGKGNGLSFFGIKSNARSVVYVIDASESMRKDNAMELARQKLWASLQELHLTSKFQIMFFNSTNHVMSVPNERQKLLPATSQNLRLAKQFIAGIQPDSGTNRLAAITQALKFEPDVIYLLTDADAPELSAKDLWEIQRTNKYRALIHVVEFGVGGDLSRDSFLKRLARENRGMHWYQDLARTGE